MRKRFLFWDNDGVLVDTESRYRQANREALARLGIALGDTQFRDISLASGGSVLDLARSAFPDPAELERLRDWRNARYADLLRTSDLVLPGVRETLRSLHRKVGMAIVTSSRRTHFDLIHSRSGLMQYFDFVLTREDYAVSKPNPEPYLLALANSGEAAGDCLVIEDSPRGLAAARGAGLECWVIPSAETAGLDFREATAILEDITDVARRLSG